MAIKFGPSGNSGSFYEAGYKHTEQAPAWLRELGLNAFEYSFGRGVSLGDKTALAIKAQAEVNGIELSVHAPYFINLAVNSDEKREKNFSYFSETAHAATALGAKRVVFHPGALTTFERSAAMAVAMDFLKEILAFLDAGGWGGLTFCPETMGKINQLGDLDEVIALCKLDQRLIPTIDFGHLHARGLGAIKSKEDYRAILDKLEAGVGVDRAKLMHVHFSRIEFTKQGEKMHHTFADTQYGPEFEPLAELVAQRGYEPHFICESKGTMAQDALYMKNAYLQAKERV